MEDVEPRRSLRLAKKKVTMGRLGKVDDPEVLPYCMAAVKSGYAGTRQINPKVFSEEEDAPLQDISEQQELTEQEEAGGDQEEATEQATKSVEELWGRGPGYLLGCPSLTPAGGRLGEDAGRLARDSYGRAGAHHRRNTDDYTIHLCRGLH